MCKNTTISRESKGLAPQNAISLQMQPCAVASQNKSPAGVQPMPSPPYAGVTAAAARACHGRRTRVRQPSYEPYRGRRTTGKSMQHDEPQRENGQGKAFFSVKEAQISIIIHIFAA